MICYVPLLMYYAVIWALIALEFIRIFILTISSGNGIWRCACCVRDACVIVCFGVSVRYVLMRVPLA